jgi:hypothetical protein
VWESKRQLLSPIPALSFAFFVPSAFCFPIMQATALKDQARGYSAAPRLYLYAFKKSNAASGISYP